METPHQPDELGALKLAYEQTIQERDRLRGARAFFARQLGPLPGFAAISVAIVGGFATDTDRRTLLGVALGLLILLVMVSLLYSGTPAYRQLRARAEVAWRARLDMTFPEIADSARRAGLNVEDMLEPRDWYIAQIQLERSLYGPPGKRNQLLLPRRKLEGTDLQDQLDRERTGVFVGQVLFLAVIACLVITRL